jgi:Putative auto-transporter adhesin, head GIN domain
MKNLLFFSVAIFFLNSCNVISGNGNVRKEKRNTPDFSGVEALGSIDIEIKKGDSPSVEVEDDDNILPYIETDVNGGVLSVHYRSGTSVTNDHAKVYVTTPSLGKVDATGSSDILIRDTLSNSNKIEMKVTGSGSIRGLVDAPSIEIAISGSGNIDLAGRTRDLNASVSGSGDLHCSDLLSENTTVRVSGSGNAHVFASLSLSATVTGSGDVYYLGNPSSPSIHTTGSGSVQAGK